MKTRITADWQDRDDEYTNTPDNKTTVRYYSDEEGDGYFYEMYVRVNGDQAAVVVTPHGVSVDFRESGESIHTNLVPMSIFPEHATLEWDQLNQILIVLRRTGIEGRVYSQEEMMEKFNRWKEETGRRGMSNFMIGRRRAGIKYEYDGDGRFDQERWSSDDKRYWTRWLRRVHKEETKEEIEDFNRLEPVAPQSSQSIPQSPAQTACLPVHRHSE